MVVGTLYQSAIILNHFEGLNLSLSALKISDLEQLNNEIFALNLLFIVIVQIGGTFAIVAAVKTDITWIKQVIKKHGENITKLQDKLCNDIR